MCSYTREGLILSRLLFSLRRTAADTTEPPPMVPMCSKAKG